MKYVITYQMKYNGADFLYPFVRHMNTYDEALNFAIDAQARGALNLKVVIV